MKKILQPLLIIFMFVIFISPAYAREGNIKKINSYPHKCNVTFFITDETPDGYPGESFKAVMTDKKENITDEYSFTEGNSWGGSRNPKYTVLAPATYTVTFEGLSEGYKVISTFDRTDEITFEAASEGIADCYWSIVKDDKNSSVSSDKKETSGNTTETPTSSDISPKNDISISGKEAGSAAFNENDAEKVYKEFYDDVKYIKDDKEWENSLLIQYKMFESDYAGWYEKYVEGGTKEEFLSMSLFDRFIWTETYLTFAWAVNTGDVNTYFGSDKNFKMHITDNVVNIIRNAKEPERVEKAYLKIANWQYEYIKKNGVPFNFINNKTYLDEINKEDENKAEEVPDSNEISKEDKKEITEAANMLLDDADKKTKEEVKKKGIWDDLLGILASNIITIIIILILLVITGIVIWWRKSLNIDDSINDGKFDNTHDQ